MTFSRFQKGAEVVGAEVVGAEVVGAEVSKSGRSVFTGGAEVSKRGRSCRGRSCRGRSVHKPLCIFGKARMRANRMTKTGKTLAIGPSRFPVSE